METTTARSRFVRFAQTAVAVIVLAVAGLGIGFAFAAHPAPVVHHSAPIVHSGIGTALHTIAL